jgi:hypothetical protein
MLASIFARAVMRPRPFTTTSTLDRLDVSNAAAGNSYDEAQAFAEGWGVFDCGYRDDRSRRAAAHRQPRVRHTAFPGRRCRLAAQHVAAAAAAGSRLHAVALASFDLVERLAIEAAPGWCPGL